MLLDLGYLLVTTTKATLSDLLGLHVVGPSKPKYVSFVINLEGWKGKLTCLYLVAGVFAALEWRCYMRT